MFSFFSFAEMATKFNQEMYTRMRGKKNEPLSTLGKRGVHVMDQGLPAVPTVNVPTLTRMAFLATSVEEIMPLK